MGMYCEQEETLAEGGITSDVSKRICTFPRKLTFTKGPKLCLMP